MTDVFQSKLKEDTKIVKQSTNVVISADKLTNINGMEKDDYNLYLRKNITKAYKKTDRGKLQSINHEAKKLLKNYQLMTESRKCKKMKHLLQQKTTKTGSATTYHVDC